MIDLQPILGIAFHDFAAGKWNGDVIPFGALLGRLNGLLGFLKQFPELMARGENRLSAILLELVTEFPDEVGGATHHLDPAVAGEGCD